MREELTDLLEQQSRLARARAEQEKKHALEINRQAQKMQLLDLQKQYQDTLKEDESRISQQKKRVNLLKRDLKQRELLMAEEARNRTYDLITQQRTAALQALIHEIDSKRAVEERRLREVEEETLERHQQLLHEKQQMEQQLAVLAEAPIPVVSKQDQLGVQLDQLTEQLIKIRSKTSQMNEKRDFRKSRKLSEAESLLEKAEFELAQEVAQRQKATCSSQHNLQAMELTTETRDLQNCIDQMHDTLVQKKLQESWDLINAARESRDERKLLEKDLAQLTDILRADTRDEFGSDLCGRNTDFYRKQQDAIKSSHDIRQRLLSQQDT
ncbi:kinectin-like isoform X2 [Nilaparvata lugens]|uniref:kinectin-like isoform X2 n=1 Tax=Nilaparvata lugens TaxID=108931 RepID=UPI00193E3866|nr:kinectin-like isoform X2 [Nilaparvata lugens]